MSEVKFKDHSKFSAFGKCESIQKHVGDDKESSQENRADYKEYVNEIFAGLMWLG